MKMILVLFLTLTNLIGGVNEPWMEKEAQANINDNNILSHLADTIYHYDIVRKEVRSKEFNKDTVLQMVVVYTLAIGEMQSASTNDFEDPAVTLEKGYGDCKTRALLLFTLLHKQGIKGLHFADGHLDKQDNKYHGHCWIEWRHKGQLYILESTDGSVYIKPKKSQYILERYIQ